MRVFLILSLLFGCAHRPKPFRPDSWGIQLQGYEKNDSFKKIQASRKSLWVVDPDALSSFQVKALKGNGKKLIAYLSVGEAEGYRRYFKSLPKDLILNENPNWKDNFTVKFWEKDWEKTLLKELSQIQEKGFDGIFLDIIDAFERFPDKKEKAEAMADLVQKISEKARKKNDDFIVILQNGIQIRNYLERPEALLKAISGVNLESRYLERGPKLLEDIRFYREAGKFLLGLEYPSEGINPVEYSAFAEQEGILPLMTDPKLDGTETAY